MPLTDRQIKNAKPADKAYKLTDGSGLYLQVTPAGGKLWRFDYAIANKRKTLSIGKYPLISLLEAREPLPPIPAGYRTNKAGYLKKMRPLPGSGRCARANGGGAYRLPLTTRCHIPYTR